MKIKFKKYWRTSSFKNKKDGNFLLKHIEKVKPKNFLEIGVFHGVTSRNVCEILHFFHGNDFKFTGIDLFLNEKDRKVLKDEYLPKTTFSNPLKTIYYRFIIKSDPYNLESVNKLLNKFKKNVNIIRGNSNEVLKKINLDGIDYVFLDGGHKYETVRNDLENLIQIVNNKGTILCDDYDLSYAPGVRKAIDEYVVSKNYNLKILNSRFAEITNKSHNL